MRIWHVLGILVVLWCGGIPLQAGYTYLFQGPNETVMEFDSPFLVPEFSSFPVLGSDLEICRFGGVACEGVFLASTRMDATFGTHDLLAFGPGVETVARLPHLALTGTGSALTLSGSAVQGRLMVYERDPDYLFEYFFKDASGERTFRYYTDRLISHERAMADGRSDLCGPGLPAGCATGDFMAGLYELDAIRFPGLLPYYFPQYAFTTLGIHYTDSLSPDSGVLTVRSVRNPFVGGGPGGPGTGDPGDSGDPGGDPEPVPEPSTWLLCGLGVLAIHRRARTRRNESIG